jgi:hypothetical protein
MSYQKSGGKRLVALRIASVSQMGFGMLRQFVKDQCGG